MREKQEVQRAAEAKDRAEAEKKKECLRAIQMPQPMTAKSDLVEYLDLFETTALKKEVKQADWMDALMPLLNDRFRSVAMKFRPEVRNDYETLKAKLQEHDNMNLKNTAATFWTLSYPRRTAGQLLNIEDRSSDWQEDS